MNMEAFYAILTVTLLVLIVALAASAVLTIVIVTLKYIIDKLEPRMRKP